MIPGGNPSMAVPGLTPTSPVMTLDPVLVTVDALSTPKPAAVPRPTGPSRTVAAVAGAAETSRRQVAASAADAAVQRVNIGDRVMMTPLNSEGVR
jgi:hypothetical protein